MYLPTEKGKIAFGLFSWGSTPSFSQGAVVSTQAPATIGVTPPPSAVRKNDRVPEPVCGRNGEMGRVLAADLAPVGVVHS